jgi:hypothetical protein
LQLRLAENAAAFPIHPINFRLEQSLKIMEKRKKE